MSLVSLVEWNVSLGSAAVSWGGVRAKRTAAKETTKMAAALGRSSCRDVILSTLFGKY